MVGLEDAEESPGRHLGGCTKVGVPYLGYLIIRESYDSAVYIGVNPHLGSGDFYDALCKAIGGTACTCLQ